MIVKNRIHPEKRAGVDKNLPLNLHVFFDQKRVCTFYTGFRFDFDKWDNENQCVVKNQVNKSGQTSSFVNLHLKAIRAAVDTWAKENPNGTKDDLLKKLRKAADKKEKVVKDEAESIYTLFDKFLIERKLSENRHDHYLVLKRSLERYETYKKITLSFDIDLHSFENFLTTEHTMSGKSQRGKNTVIGLIKKLRSFYIWSIENEYTTKNPFAKFKIDTAKYGTPFFLTITERNLLYNFDLSKRKELSIQRDIFIFQCLVGCRVGDLMRLTNSQIKEGFFLEYVAGKTKDDEPTTIRVPLNETAKQIIKRYEGGAKLLPCISEVNYNLAIKEMFLMAGLTRTVTVLNTVTRKDEQRPLNEVASSHISRRTFIGNLYAKVQDPNIVGSMSGHVEGSKAFARYRTIDDKIKTDMISLIE